MQRGCNIFYTSDNEILLDFVELHWHWHFSVFQYPNIAY